jgi:hypothetical protein
LTASNEAQLATRNRAELRKWFVLPRKNGSCESQGERNEALAPFFSLIASVMLAITSLRHIFRNSALEA